MNRSTVTLFVSFYLFASYTIENVLLNEMKWNEMLFYFNFLFLCDHPQSRSRDEMNIPRSRDRYHAMNDMTQPFVILLFKEN